MLPGSEFFVISKMQCQPLLEQGDALYDSIAIAHDTRKFADLSTEKMKDYMARVLDALVDRLTADWHLNATATSIILKPKTCRRSVYLGATDAGYQTHSLRSRGWRAGRWLEADRLTVMRSSPVAHSPGSNRTMLLSLTMKNGHTISM